MKDSSRKPELEVSDLILDIKHSPLSGFEPFYVTFFVRVNMEKYEVPKTKFDPGKTNNDVKIYGGSPVIQTISYTARKEDYSLEIHVRDYKQRWQVRTYPIHVDKNPAESLIKHFSINPPIALLDTENKAKVGFDLVCDNNLKFVKWIFDDKKLNDPPEERSPSQQREYTYRKDGTFEGMIQVYERGTERKEPEIRKFQILVLDPKNFVNL